MVIQYAGQRAELHQGAAAVVLGKYVTDACLDVTVGEGRIDG
jgi:hypothetical protein